MSAASPYRRTIFRCRAYRRCAVNYIAKFITTERLGASGIVETGGGQVGIGTARNQSAGMMAPTLNTTSAGKPIGGNTPGFEPFSVDGFGNAGVNSLVAYGNAAAGFSTIAAFTATGPGLDGADSYGDNNRVR